MGNGDRQGGLSVGESIAAAHRSLDDLFARYRRSLEEGPAEAASESFQGLSEALETHFEQEDCLYYPPIAALRSGRREAVRAFAAAHDGFRGDLREIAALLESGSLEGAVRLFDRFAETFSSPEAAEEALLAGLDREVSAAR